MRHLEYRLHFGRVLYRRCSLPDTRQLGTLGDDGSRLRRKDRQRDCATGTGWERQQPKCGGCVSNASFYLVPLSNPVASYFKPKAHTLDYPNNETSRASRKYVKAMKQLHVSGASYYNPRDSNKASRG